MDLAFIEAEAAFSRGEVPIGAVIVDTRFSLPLARAGNRTREWSDPTAHAEILVLRSAAAKCAALHLPNCDLYVTLEPCPMCAAAIAFTRIRRLYFGAYNPKSGAVEHGPCLFSLPTCHHWPEVYGGLQESRSAALLRHFFEIRR